QFFDRRSETEVPASLGRDCGEFWSPRCQSTEADYVFVVCCVFPVTISGPQTKICQFIANKPQTLGSSQVIGAQSRSPRRIRNVPGNVEKLSFLALGGA